MRKAEHPRSPARRIGILMRSGEFINRGVLRGVLRYVAENPLLSVVGAASSLRAGEVLRRYRPDGIIACAVPAEGFDAPTVSVIYPQARGTHVAMDEAAVGTMAVSHFLDRGFRHFAFVGYPSQWWSNAREAGFLAALERLFPEHARPVPRFNRGRFISSRWRPTPLDLTTWIHRLPKPVAILACHDGRGRETIEAALADGWRVPEDVAVLGVDNDDIECYMAHVPLSSVIYPCIEVGYRAAELLARKMAGQRTPEGTISIAPHGIVTRRSTDVLAVEDEVVARAYRHIQEHAGAPLSVADVARHSGVARRTLQLRYRQVLGRAVRDDLVQARIRLATALLTESRLPLKTVAVRAGFSSAIHLSRVVRAKLHTTPGALRRQSAPPAWRPFAGPAERFSSAFR